MDIKTVTVIGANGTMGRNVAALFASFGNAKVYLLCRDLEKAKATVAKSCASVRADSIRTNLVPADYSMMAQCVGESDLVLEHVREDMATKKDIIGQAAKYLQPGAVLCSGSSGLSVTALAECLPEEQRSRFFGVHMFNPPYAMVLCELIPTRYSDRAMLEELRGYLSDTLYRTVVEVKDSPAFLGNRIGFQFINKALQYAEKYKDNGGVDYIDAILGGYTGRLMAPITTTDFVGLDIHKAIVDNIYENTADYARETFVCPEYINRLVREGMLGRKTGKGLYWLQKSDNGTKKMMVYDIASGEYREQIKYVFPFADIMINKLKIGSYASAFRELVSNRSQEARICLDFLLEYVIYSLVVAEQVGYGVDSADDVMATGFNWCPPLAMAEALSSVTDFKALVQERLTLQGVDTEHCLSLIKPSKYDYRMYFRAKK